MTNRSIYYSSKSESQSIIRIESCMFSLARYEFFDHGGNIYIKNCCECIQDKICCFNCSLINTGKHSYVRVANNTDSKNYIFQSSISQLSGHGSGAFVHRKGDIQVKDINITNCKNSVGSAFQIREISKNSTTLQSNINNNTATNNIGLAFLDSKDFYFTISNCNIIKQNVHDKYDLSGVIILKGKAIFDSCVITDNIHPKGYLFKTINDDQVENVIIISNSFMNNPDAQTVNGKQPVIMNGVANIDNIKIEFLTSQICHEINFFQLIKSRRGQIQIRCSSIFDTLLILLLPKHV